MPKKLVTYTENQIVRARQMRRLGFTYEEIGREVGMSPFMCFYHLKGVPCDKDGTRKLARFFSDVITMWRPGAPVPLPEWLVGVITEGQGMKVNDAKGELTITVLGAQGKN